LPENTEYDEKYLFSDNVRFPAEVEAYHATGSIGQLIKIDIYGHKLNYEQRLKTQTARTDQLKKHKSHHLVFRLRE